MTKCILHGGETGVPNKNNQAFYQEWVKGFPDDFIPTILLVYFSRKKEEWERLEQQDRERFAKYTNGRKANFVVADADLDTLRKQIKSADVIYARGGSSDELIRALTPIKDELRGLLEGKVYAGSSAGVMALSHRTASTFSDSRDGLGVFPIDSFVHWDERFRDKLGSFTRNDKYELLLIPETEFVVRQY
jgi:peptidase E